MRSRSRFGVAAVLVVIAGVGTILAVRAFRRSSAPALGKEVYIAGGDATLGTKCGSSKHDQCPPRQVAVKAFWIDQTEVTVAAYQGCIAAGVCTPSQWNASADFAKKKGDCNSDELGREQHPVNCVNFEQATAYCSWVGRRLPTYQEWEFAARGGSARTYPWGNEEKEPSCSRAVFARADHEDPNGHFHTGCKEFGSGTAPVGFADGATPEGVLDMAGNVAEWTGGEPMGCEACGKDGRALYGGGWQARWDRIYAFRRIVWPKVSATAVTGFRCARDGGREKQ